MSEERERFPIQPADRRRTARSSKDIKAVPDELPEQEQEKSPDKPAVPPHRRHERDDDSERRGDDGDDAGGDDAGSADGDDAGDREG